MPDRSKIKHAVAVAVLTEAGYRCAVPTCRSILAIDLHHIVEVSKGGDNEAGNLLPLCPTCHALYHRGVITAESIFTWKSILVSLGQAFDVAALDQLIFLSKAKVRTLNVSGDGVLQFYRLIAADLATFYMHMENGPLVVYRVHLTDRGNALVAAWNSGDRKAVERVLSGEFSQRAGATATGVIIVGSPATLPNAPDT